MRRLFIALLLAAPFGQAEPIVLVTGDLPPFVMEKGPRRGVSADIVSAAFAAEGGQVSFVYMPWKRGYVLAERGDFIGTLPYARNPERESAFLYSEPIMIDRLVLFIRAGQSQPADWNGKSLCVPLGFDVTRLSPFTSRYSVTLDRPAGLENCFRMLALDRVDGALVGQASGQELARRLFGDMPQVEMLNLDIGSDVTHLIISRRLPQAQDWLQRFNRGLATIRKNGSYERLLKEAAEQ